MSASALRLASSMSFLMRSRRFSSSGGSVTASRSSSNGLRIASSSWISFLTSAVALRMSRMIFPSPEASSGSFFGSENDQGEEQNHGDLAHSEVEHGDVI